jgi:hypothetical protein
VQDADTSLVKSLDMNVDMATKIIDELDAARATMVVRDWFAMRRCSLGVIPNLLMWLLLLSASPSFYDGYLSYDSFLFNDGMANTFNHKLGAPGSETNDPVVWLDTWRQDASLRGAFDFARDAVYANSSSSGGTATTSTNACRVQFNSQSSYLVGPLQLRVRRFREATHCSAARPQRWFIQARIAHLLLAGRAAQLWSD